MKVLGIDPGYDRAGVAILSGNGSAPEHVFSTCFLTARTAPLSERLNSLAEQLRALIKEHAPEVCAIETLYLTKNHKTAMGVAAARGAAMSVAAELGLLVCEYSPSQVKVAVTGYGKSDKTAVMRMVARLIPPSKSAKFDDEVDAIAVALTHLASARPTSVDK